MTLETVQDVFAAQLGCLRDIESQLLGALPRIASAAHEDDLRAAFSTHVDETLRHRSRLDWSIRCVDVPVPETPAEAMRALLREAEMLIGSATPNPVRDVALIAIGQNIEQYEIAVYSTAHRLARLLFYGEVETLLGATLEEERKADGRLEKLAHGSLGWSGIDDRAAG
jgi:ferritin-like metal-binding protein YciE